MYSNGIVSLWLQMRAENGFTFKTSSVGLTMFNTRRAVLVTGTSSNVTIDLTENNASTTTVGSREAAFFCAFLMCGGVKATYTIDMKMI